MIGRGSADHYPLMELYLVLSRYTPKTLNTETLKAETLKTEPRKTESLETLKNLRKNIFKIH